MQDVFGTVDYNDKTYKFVFNFNVMESIQEKYGSFQEWADATQGKDSGEPNAKALKAGFLEMLNEGIDIENEENGTGIPFLTERQVGRMITRLGMSEVAEVMQSTVVASTKGDNEGNE